MILESLQPSSYEGSGKSMSSKYKKSRNENQAITPRSGLDAGMSFSFSSFGDDESESSPINRLQFKPTRTSFKRRNKVRKLVKPTEVGPLILHEYGTTSG